ncbi:MAG TPA: zinc ABC transporter substrate-binding protein [Thermoanaerobaculia bacterium]|nr:zinc ABC transporter substrate-binding protein [Thermoanaerobaculia bacterium]
MPKILRLLPLLLLLPALLVLAACDGQGGAASSDGDGDRKLRVVATTGIIADTAARVAGSHAEVEGLMGPGVDPHLYKASESDVRRLAEADLVLYNGLHLEGKMGDILGKMGRNRPVVAVAEDIPKESLRTPPEFQGQPDPHVWFDVSLWAKTLGPIARALSELDLGNAADYQANAAAYEKELLELDAWVAEEVARIPEGQRVLVTAHDAFGYFGRRYGVDVIGLQGISTLSEAGLNDVDRVVQIVLDRRVKAIFVESSVPRRSIEAVQAAAASRGHQVRIGGQLFSDSLGGPATPAATYPGMVRVNVETIVKALR